MRCASSEDFELRYIGYRGLNLTFEMREGIIKHSRDYDAREIPELKEYLLDQRPTAGSADHRFDRRDRLQHRRPR